MTALFRRILVVTPLCAGLSAWGADPDPQKVTWGRFKPSFEFRTWIEHRDGPAFGLQPNWTTALVRTRFNLEYKVSDWVRVGGTMQDAHAPGLPQPRPGTASNPTELHEAYVDYGKPGAAGWGGFVGRKRFWLGSQTVIGLPEWSNAGRTYDAARLYWQNSSVHLGVLFTSSVKFNANGFDKPVLGDRIWGTYNTFNKLIPKGKVDAWLLQHDQNRPGGYLGPGSLGTLTYGARLYGTAAPRLNYDIDMMGQGGHIGPLSQRAYGMNAAITTPRVFTPALDWIFEYKYASGTDPGSGHSSTFDQLYPAAHERLGHADLLGFRNMIAARWINRVRWGKHTTISITYTHNWLAQARDAAYDLSGRAFARSADGSAGRHVGQEAAIYSVHRFGHFVFGAAIAYWWTGRFIQETTPNVRPIYFYLHNGFTF